MCQTHWNELRQAIDVRGMTPLVAKDGHAAMERAVSEIEGTDKADDYDPLMAANWMISGKALELGGLYLMTGDYCPLCEVEKQGMGLATEWINGCTDSILQYVHDVTTPLPKGERLLGQRIRQEPLR